MFTPDGLSVYSPLPVYPVATSDYDSEIDPCGYAISEGQADGYLQEYFAGTGYDGPIVAELGEREWAGEWIVGYFLKPSR